MKDVSSVYTEKRELRPFLAEGFLLFRKEKVKCGKGHRAGLIDLSLRFQIRSKRICVAIEFINALCGTGLPKYSLTKLLL